MQKKEIFYLVWLSKWQTRDKYNPLKAGYDDVDINYIIESRKEEIMKFLISCKQAIQQLLEIFSCGKNEALIHDLFEYLLPQKVAMMLK